MVNVFRLVVLVSIYSIIPVKLVLLLVRYVSIPAIVTHAIWDTILTEVTIAQAFVKLAPFPI